MAADRPWRRRARAATGTVRVRTTVAAVVVVGTAMAVGALVLVAVLRDTLVREVRTAARLRGQDVAAVLATDAAGRGPLAVDDADELLIQVLDEGGRVVRASPEANGLAPVARLRPGGSVEVELPAGGPVEEDGKFLVVASAVETPVGPRTVLVARSTEPVTETAAAVGGLLAVGLPLLLAVVAATTWTVVGRALAPVEAIRAEVDAISAAALHRRVPDPPADDEIGRLARTMNRMLARLERAQARQRRLVADASHELRSPVAAIRQHAEVALAHPGRTTTTELAGTVLAEDLRLQRLAEDLLLLTRADEHSLALRRRPVDLDDLVFEEAGRLRDATRLRVDTAAVSAARVEGDAAALPGCCATWPTTPPATPAGGWRSRSPSATAWPCCGSTTTGPASQWRTGSGYSSGSCASTTPAPATTAAAASAWPSWPSWWPRTAARWPSPPAPRRRPGRGRPSPARRPRGLNAPSAVFRLRSGALPHAAEPHRATREEPPCSPGPDGSPPPGWPRPWPAGSPPRPPAATPTSSSPGRPATGRSRPPWPPPAAGPCWRPRPATTAPPTASRSAWPTAARSRSSSTRPSGSWAGKPTRTAPGRSRDDDPPPGRRPGRDRARPRPGGRGLPARRRDDPTRRPGDQHARHRRHRPLCPERAGQRLPPGRPGGRPGRPGPAQLHRPDPHHQPPLSGGQPHPDPPARPRGRQAAAGRSHQAPPAQDHRMGPAPGRHRRLPIRRLPGRAHPGGGGRLLRPGRRWLSLVLRRGRGQLPGRHRGRPRRQLAGGPGRPPGDDHARRSPGG